MKKFFSTLLMLTLLSSAVAYAAEAPAVTTETTPTLTVETKINDIITEAAEGTDKIISIRNGKKTQITNVRGIATPEIAEDDQALLADVTVALDAKVAAGTITQEQEDAFIQRISHMLTYGRGLNRDTLGMLSDVTGMTEAAVIAEIITGASAYSLLTNDAMKVAYLDAMVAMQEEAKAARQEAMEARQAARQAVQEAAQLTRNTQTTHTYFVPNPHGGPGRR